MARGPTTRREFVQGAAMVIAGGACARVLGQQGRSPATGASMTATTAAAAATSRSDAMITRAIPSTSEALPVIGMGTWQTFDPPKLDDASLAPLEEVTRLFFDAGARVIDSSPMYGKAERVTGTLSQRLKINDQLFLATKVWTRGQEAGIRQMEDSMQKLGRAGGKLDLMQVHNLVDWQTHLKTLRTWKQRGRIRYLGVTHYARSAFDELEQIIRNERIDFVQLPYSLGNRAAEERLLPAAQENGVAVLVMRPFEEGELFGRVRGKPLPDSVKPYAQSWAGAFLKWIIAHPAVTCVIPATNKPQHMRDNLAAGTGRLPDPHERDALARLLAS